MKNHEITAIVLSVASLALAPGAEAQQIIAPIAATIDLGGPGFGSITNTFDQSGLSSSYVAGATDFDAYVAANIIHTDIFSGFEWFSNLSTTAATVTYDFGSVAGIDRLALWNEEIAGIGLLNLLSSTDGISFTSLGSFSPTDNPEGSYSADVFNFTSTAARYVRFEMSGCPQADPGSFQACAIGEVAFRSTSLIAAVPEPATWAFMLLGFGVVGGAMRQRKAKVAVRFA